MPFTALVFLSPNSDSFQKISSPRACHVVRSNDLEDLESNYNGAKGVGDDGGRFHDKGRSAETDAETIEGKKLKLTGETKTNCIGRVRGRIQRSMTELLYNWDLHEVDRLSEELIDIVLSFTPSSSTDISD